MKTAREVYLRSLALMGEEDGENTTVFEGRWIPLINVLLGEVYDLDLALKGEEGSFGNGIPQVVSAEEEIWMEEAILFSLLPLGLAALLLGETEPERASFFQGLYQKERDQLRARCRRGRRHKISRPY